MVRDPYAAQAANRMMPGTLGGRAGIAQPRTPRRVVVKRRAPYVPSEHTVVFDFAGSNNWTGVVQYLTVPSGVTSLHVVALGGQIPTNTVFGGFVECDLAVTPGETLEVRIGGSGGYEWFAGTEAYNGGGAGGVGAGGAVHRNGLVGAGATDLRQGGSTLADRVIVAGGAGGHQTNSGTGGDGGDPDGKDGDNGVSGSGGAPGDGHGTGATQIAAGSGGSIIDPNGNAGSSGMLGTGGTGGDCVDDPMIPTHKGVGGDGGGGGYYGGGGGAGFTDGGTFFAGAGAGGGGSSYADTGVCSSVSYSTGSIFTGQGQLSISYVR